MDYEALICGGMSWGDTPSEGTDAIWDLCMSESIYSKLLAWAREDAAAATDSASDSPTNYEDKYMALYDAAVEAIEHMAQANWSGREKAALSYLHLVAKDNGNTKSLEEIQREINLG